MARLNKDVSFRRPTKGRIPVVETQLEDPRADAEDTFSSIDSAIVYNLLGQHMGTLTEMAKERLKNSCMDISDKPKLQKMALNLLVAKAVRDGQSLEQFYEQVEFEREHSVVNLGDVMEAADANTLSDSIGTAPITVTAFLMKNAPTKICGDFLLEMREMVTADISDNMDSIISTEYAEEGSADEAIEQEILNVITAIIAIFFFWIIEVALLVVLKYFLGMINFWPLKGLYKVIKGAIQRLIRHIGGIVMRMVLGIDSDDPSQLIKSEQFAFILNTAGANIFLRVTDRIGIT